MKYTLDLHNGFKCNDSGNILKFGMTSEEVASLLGEEPINKMPSKQSTLEYFSDLRVDFINGSAAAFEFYMAAEVFIDDEEYPLFKNVDLLKTKMSKLKKIAMTYDPECDDDSAGITSLKLGIGTYSDGKLPESVIVFKDGYYDN